MPPSQIDTYFNGKKFIARTPRRSFEAKLQTEVSRSDGMLARTIRKTEVEVYEVGNGEEAYLYELGIRSPYCVRHIRQNLNIPHHITRYF